MARVDRMRRLPFLLLGLALGACAGAPRRPAVPPPVDLAGTWDWQSEEAATGQGGAGSMTIVRADTGYGGTVEQQGGPDLQIQSARVAGDSVVLRIAGPDFLIWAGATLAGRDSMNGTWNDTRGASGTFWAKRRIP